MVLIPEREVRAEGGSWMSAPNSVCVAGAEDGADDDGTDETSTEHESLLVLADESAVGDEDGPRYVSL